MSDLPPPPPPPLPPPLSALAKESFLRLAEQEKPGKFEPFHLNKPSRRSYPKGKLPSPYIPPVSITPERLKYSRQGLKELRGIAKVPVDLGLANARDSLRQVYHHPVGTTTRIVAAAAAAPLDHPPLAFKITPKPRNGPKSHHGGSKKRSRKHKKSHRKKSHKRSHKRH